MDYEKEYKEALNRARGFKTQEYKDVAAYIFKELAESEDEKIRKDIISFVEQAINAGYGIISKERKEKWIAWLEKQGEQKPAWSEEDEDILKLVIARLHSHTNVEFEEYCKEYNWLKSLKDRVQPRQEWSEKDDEHVKSITSTIECCKVHYPNSPSVIEAYNSDLDWLKSLRPQKQWKPTEVQLNILAETIHDDELSGRRVILKNYWNN